MNDHAIHMRSDEVEFDGKRLKILNSGRVNLILHGLMATMVGKDYWRILIPNPHLPKVGLVHANLYGNPAMQCTLPDSNGAPPPAGTACLHALYPGSYAVELDGIQPAPLPTIDQNSHITLFSDVLDVNDQNFPGDDCAVFAEILIPPPHLIRAYRGVELGLPSPTPLADSVSGSQIGLMPAVLNEVLVLSYFGTPDHPRMTGSHFSYPLPKPGYNIWNLCLYSEPLTATGMDHSPLLTGMFLLKTSPSGQKDTPIGIPGLLTTNRLDRPADTAPNVGVSQTELMTLVELSLPPGNTMSMAASEENIFGFPLQLMCGEPGGCGQTIVCPGAMLQH